MKCYVNGVLQGSDPGYMHVREQRAANTSGGTFTAGAWRTRSLNTVVANTIAGASLESDILTLPPGAYDLIWVAPGHNPTKHISRLWSITSSSIVGASSSAYTNSTVTQTDSRGRVRATFAVPTQIRLEHYCSGSQNTTGLGAPCNLDNQPEVYSEVWVYRRS